MSILPSNVQNQMVINLFQNNLSLSAPVLAIIQAHNKALNSNSLKGESTVIEEVEENKY